MTQFTGKVAHATGGSSEGAGFVTGHSLLVDGGCTAP
jgi:hypothetical protein